MLTISVRVGSESIIVITLSTMRMSEVRSNHSHSTSRMQLRRSGECTVKPHRMEYGYFNLEPGIAYDCERECGRGEREEKSQGVMRA